jgi:hypothetical protein
MSPTELARRVGGPVLTAHDAGYATEVAGFNSVAVTTPEIVVGATSARDVVEAVSFARAHGHAVHVQSTGHGGPHMIRSGVLVSTRRMNTVRIDASTRVATIGAGAQWAAVIAAAAEHGLAPISGSSTTVGVVGYILGGGFGPLVRSHGVSSDYILGARVVTGAGELVEASAESHADLFWALRGGKYGLGVVTEMRLRLVPLPALYAGALLFDEPQIEAGLRAWIDYTAGADPQVTTSAAIAKFPPLDRLPPALRGRRLLAVRFAYPGPADEGVRLAAPLRAAAPIYQDTLAELPIADVARIHNDPTDPLPAWSRGALLERVDQAFATTLLGHVGAGTDAPFVAAELRQLGNATTRDVPSGSAVGGRGAAFTTTLIGAPKPELFASVIPAAAERIHASFAPWLSAENNINFLGEPADPVRIETAWPGEMRARLEEIRRRYGA